MFIFSLAKSKNFPSQVQKILPNTLHGAANCPILPFTLLVTAIFMFACTCVYTQNISKIAMMRHRID